MQVRILSGSPLLEGFVLKKILAALFILISTAAYAQEKPSCPTEQAVMQVAVSGAKSNKYVTFDKDEAIDDVRTFLFVKFHVDPNDLADIKRVYMLEYKYYAGLFVFKNDGCLGFTLPFNFKDGTILTQLLQQKQKSL